MGKDWFYTQRGKEQRKESKSPEKAGRQGRKGKKGVSVGACGGFGLSCSKAGDFEGRVQPASNFNFVYIRDVNPLSCSQIYSKVGYTCKYLEEVVLWKLNIRAVTGAVGPERDLEPKARRKRSSPTRPQDLGEALDNRQSQEEGMIILSRSGGSERLQQTTGIKRNRQTRAIHTERKPSLNRLSLELIASFLTQ